MRLTVAIVLVLGCSNTAYSPAGEPDGGTVPVCASTLPYAVACELAVRSWCRAYGCADDECSACLSSRTCLVANAPCVPLDGLVECFASLNTSTLDCSFIVPL